MSKTLITRKVKEDGQKIVEVDEFYYEKLMETIDGLCDEVERLTNTLLEIKQEIVDQNGIKYFKDHFENIDQSIELCGLKVVEDVTLPEGVVEIRDGNKVLGRITGIKE